MSFLDKLYISGHSSSDIVIRLNVLMTITEVLVIFFNIFVCFCGLNCDIILHVLVDEDVSRKGENKFG